MTLARPILKWLVFAICIGSFLVAMVWISQRTLAMDRARESAERERLALWRMDSMVSALLIRENARPPGHYQAFQSPDDLFDNRSQKEIAKGRALTPSPLLGDLPEFVRLHFQMQPNMIACSPQVPTGSDLSLANTWYVISPQLDSAKQRLADLSLLMRRHPQAFAVRVPAGATAAVSSKQDMLPQEKEVSNGLSAQTVPEANKQEMRQRADVALGNASQSAAIFNAMPPKKVGGGTLNMKPSSATEGASAGGGASTRRTIAPTKLGDAEAQSQALAPALAQAQTIAVTSPPGDLRPLWLDNELFLMRTATVDGQSVLQGLWLDWPALQERLLGTIRDLLPQAKLVPVATALEDASALATLPVRLVPGMVPSVAGLSPLQRTLLIAWSCFLIAALAVGLVLHRAMLLSERRGAFVSAVTHELRTPLTTFQLYSEMLADDMVPDATKRREYLRTLCDESTRLTHLVENVLSYSRIERGRTAARREKVKTGDLISRIEPRLRQRAQPCGLELQVAVSPEAAATTVDVDALAVEQIVFNLVDNACKYAAPASTEPLLHLEVSVETSHVIVRLRDHGPGFSKAQLKRLFMPFEKSATEAAHSAPGVGLGLALCRRLARELGGDLVLESGSNSSGACFRLALPVHA